jgi:putative ABC transport system permease protein
MNQQLSSIPLENLALAFIPVGAVIFILFKWSLDSKRALYALSRMLVQLLLIGYVLTYLFKSDSALVMFLVLLIMLSFSSWIALSNINISRIKLLKAALISIFFSGSFTLFIVTQGVLELQPWYQAQALIPLAGMIFANCMNSVSLSGERFHAELQRGESYLNA